MIFAKVSGQKGLQNVKLSFSVLSTLNLTANVIICYSKMTGICC